MLWVNVEFDDFWTEIGADGAVNLVLELVFCVPVDKGRLADILISDDNDLED